ncbi:hypothetical protein F4775DRAFT_555297 [Biscogniauxia sp. FL1348]|nr:hypothetical protein F4775DRAFT_555297 [Biscogniauxia sp. FL1348]
MSLVMVVLGRGTAAFVSALLILSMLRCARHLLSNTSRPVEGNVTLAYCHLRGLTASSDSPWHHVRPLSCHRLYHRAQASGSCKPHTHSRSTCSAWRLDAPPPPPPPPPPPFPSPPLQVSPTSMLSQSTCQNDRTARSRSYVPASWDRYFKVFVSSNQMRLNLELMESSTWCVWTSAENKQTGFYADR